jgi:hypothetical protein
MLGEGCSSGLLGDLASYRDSFVLHLGLFEQFKWQRCERRHETVAAIPLRLYGPAVVGRTKEAACPFARCGS